jgi:hypothetical protein
MDMTTAQRTQLQKYYALPLWAEYMNAYKLWEAQHAAYTLNPNLATRTKLIEAMDLKDKLISQLRETPQHKLAFGW